MLGNVAMPFYPRAYDNQQSTKIIVDTTSGEQVTLTYKKRDKFHFKVGGGLTLRNIQFDGTDSLIMVRQQCNLLLQITDDTENCLGKSENCCSVNIADGTISGNTNICKINRKMYLLKDYAFRNEECLFSSNYGAGLFAFDISSQTKLTQPPTLEIEVAIYFIKSIELQIFTLSL